MKYSNIGKEAETPRRASGNDFEGMDVRHATASAAGAGQVQSLLLRPKDAAAMLAISPRKLWELTNMREVPCVRIGRCLRYPREALRAWVENRQGRKY